MDGPPVSKIKFKYLAKVSKIFYRAKSDPKVLVAIRAHLDWLVYLEAEVLLDLLVQREEEDLLAQLDLRDPKESREKGECKAWLDRLVLREKQGALVTLVHLALLEKQELLA